MRKIVIALLILSSFRILISCCKELTYNFRWSTINVSNRIILNDSTAAFTADSVRIENYSFRISFDHEKVAYNFINDFGLTSSYALSCNSLNYNKDSITAVQVITLNTFNNTHPAGSSISEYLLARPVDPYYIIPNNIFKSLSDQLGLLNSEDFFFLNMLDVKFKNVSHHVGQHRFAVQVLFKSGRLISDTTSIRLY